MIISKPGILSIATGVTADSTIPDKEKEVGQNILNAMEGNNALEYTSKRKDRAITMSSKVHAMVDGESIEVDPQLLFQRLLTAARGITENIADIFKYELCSLPTSLFAT